MKVDLEQEVKVMEHFFYKSTNIYNNRNMSFSNLNVVVQFFFFNKINFKIKKENQQLNQYYFLNS